MVVSIFGGALTLPILSAESNDMGKRLVTASFLFFGTNTISCLFWLLRVTLPDEADLTDELSSMEKLLLVLIGTIGHTLFNVAGLILLAATAVTYTPSFKLGVVCVGVMSATAIFYLLSGFRHITRIPWSQLRS
ncbi:hypothetical protein BDZ94DRAFT_1259918 [Collybia nuda]|uniref:Uncharacterized protein n=1 Tax=Collybia nuda TaxID=64659 RepID=A0A9P5Y7A0_9AGAR|nr:hypothetical protein BDZ94DRAFT_1259918 [Collybia nuda]